MAGTSRAVDGRLVCCAATHGKRVVEKGGLDGDGLSVECAKAIKRLCSADVDDQGQQRGMRR